MVSRTRLNVTFIVNCLSSCVIILLELVNILVDFTKYYYVTQYVWQTVQAKSELWKQRQNHNAENCDEFFDCFDYHEPNVGVEWLTVLFRNLEFQVSKSGTKIDCLRFWIVSVPAGDKRWHSTSKQTTTASFHTAPDPLIIPPCDSTCCCITLLVVNMRTCTQCHFFTCKISHSEQLNKPWVRRYKSRKYGNKTCKTRSIWYGSPSLSLQIEWIFGNTANSSTHAKWFVLQLATGIVTNIDVNCGFQYVRTTIVCEQKIIPQESVLTFFKMLPKFSWKD